MLNLAVIRLIYAVLGVLLGVAHAPCAQRFVPCGAVNARLTTYAHAAARLAQTTAYAGRMRRM